MKSFVWPGLFSLCLGVPLLFAAEDAAYARGVTYGRAPCAPGAP